MVVQISRRLALRQLTPMASAFPQEKYIRNGTRDEYYVPGQIVEDGHVVARFLEAASGWAAVLGEAELGAAARFSQALSKLPSHLVEVASADELLDSPEWIELRQSAAVLLAALGGNLSELEAENA